MDRMVASYSRTPEAHEVMKGLPGRVARLCVDAPQLTRLIHYLPLPHAFLKTTIPFTSARIVKILKTTTKGIGKLPSSVLYIPKSANPDIETIINIDIAAFIIVLPTTTASPLPPLAQAICPR